MKVCRITDQYLSSNYKHYNEKFEDTKGVIRIRISKKDRQHNVQKKKDKGTNNDLQNTTQKTKEQTTQAPLRHGGEPSNLIFIDKCSGFF